MFFLYAILFSKYVILDPLRLVCFTALITRVFLPFSRRLSAASTLCNIDGKQGDRNPQGAQRRRSDTNGEGERLLFFPSESLVSLKMVLA